ncbi:MAG TPA: hypothetical protein ENG83_11760 [Nitrospirae bacterium]|nr:xyloglucanase precursor [bacterium BMS3Abin06]HDH12850.1 hypothetical protein [Nitrospirota bacterium]HDZ01627.1 hypothetical protein [Nitrospirota bacterium]
MIRKGVLYVAAIYVFICLAAASVAGADMQEMEWKEVGRGIRDSDLQTVAVSPDNPDLVFMNSFNAVYRTTNGGKNWDEVLSFRGTGKAINAIVITPSNAKIVYAATDDGLYRSDNTGMKWEKIFSAVGDSGKAVLCAAVDPEDPGVIYVGTGAGLFFTKNNGKDWKRGRNLPSDSSLYFIAVDRSNPHIIYAAADKGLYKSSNSGGSWERILKTNFNAEDRASQDDPDADEIDEIKIENRIQSIAIDPSDNGTVYAGTSQGLMVTADGGSTWKAISSLGLGSRDIRHIAINSSDTGHLYAATGRGVFRYSKSTGTWDELYKGIISPDVRYLAFASDTRNNFPSLWAATKRGIFKSLPSVSVSAQQNIALRNRIKETEERLSMFAHEPSIGEIREAAIIYAEVQPGKIEKWRKAAAHRAWLPDLKFAYDKGNDWQSSTYFYNYKGEEKYRDDDITRGDDSGWSISLTWELGDLIWNSSQTSIDVRSKLMVQLRDDILNEVTRLYFERRRLQIELLMSPPGDTKDRIEKDLRLQELTANIDALTGSYLSKRLGNTELSARR